MRIKGKYLSRFLGYGLLFYISMRVLVLDWYQVTSSSMENTLLPKDMIVVNKLHYGTLLPRSPYDINIFSVLVYLVGWGRNRIRADWWRPYRLWGYDEIKNGDIIVYEYPQKFNFYVKRCVGIAGDTLEVKSSKVIINGKTQATLPTYKKNYRFKIDDYFDFSQKTDTMNLYPYQLRVMPKESQWWRADIGVGDLKHLEAAGLAKQASPLYAQRQVYDLFATLPNTSWTIDDLGPFVIPRKGWTMVLNERNYLLYKSIIQQYEQKDIKKEGDTFLIDGTPQQHYTFGEDYYFMMGDHRYDSRDSRYLGFVPKHKIIGKATYVLYSFYQDTFRWSRFLKKLK